MPVCLSGSYMYMARDMARYWVPRPSYIWTALQGCGQWYLNRIRGQSMGIRNTARFALWPQVAVACALCIYRRSCLGYQLQGMI